MNEQAKETDIQDKNLQEEDFPNNEDNITTSVIERGKKIVVAICYDFDGTLSPRNMQEYGFFEKLGEEAKEFWNESEKMAKKNNADPILAYMKLMVDKAKIGNIGTTRADFLKYGKSVKLFEGVKTWFDRVSKYGEKHEIKVEHYIVSSGLKEMIEGTSIGEKFEKIYACSFFYDNNDVAVWPAVAVNYTTKTQFLFRINKGIKNDNDNKKINRYIQEEKRRVPFSKMIYIGDGATDVPCMKLVKDKGGYSIAVYDSVKLSKKEETEKLLSDGRVNFVSEASYNKSSRMEQLVFAILDEIVAKEKVVAFSKKSPVTEKSR
jgi:2-hydroxy-3-keto-5-methylthiopentenyl-1-phosphate phosphatase